MPDRDRPPVWTVALVCLLLGCSGGNDYAFEQGEIAERFIPVTRYVEAHPDSLQDVTLRGQSVGEPALMAQTSYKALMLKWSSRYQSLSGGGRNRQRLTHATLWSRELSLLSLEAELGLSGLSPDKRAEFIQKREEDYGQSLQIDVFLFNTLGSIIAGPGTTVTLRDLDGNAYAPARRTYGPIRQVFVARGRDMSRRGRAMARGQVIYRRNTFYFKRIQDETDILDGTRGLQLEIRPQGTGEEYRFEWQWGGDSAARASGE